MQTLNAQQIPGIYLAQHIPGIYLAQQIPGIYLAHQIPCIYLAQHFPHLLSHVLFYPFNSLSLNVPITVQTVYLFGCAQSTIPNVQTVPFILLPFNCTYCTVQTVPILLLLIDCPYFPNCSYPDALNRLSLLSKLFLLRCTRSTVPDFQTVPILLCEVDCHYCPNCSYSVAHP